MLGNEMEFAELNMELDDAFEQQSDGEQEVDEELQERFEPWIW